MKTVIFDIEADKLDFIDNLWCIVCKDIDEKEQRWWTCLTGYDEFLEYAKTVDRWVAHNGISYDRRILNDWFGYEVIELDKLVDTFVVSRTVNYSNFKGHGLDEIGAALGKRKTYFKKFSEYSEEMLEYCKDDVALNERIFNFFKRFIDDPVWQKSLECEHKTAYLCEQMHWNGFKFDIDTARQVLPEIQHRMMELEAEFQDIWPPKLVEVNRIQYRVKDDGTIYKTVTNARSNYPKTEVDSDTSELVCFDYKSFNPASTPDRIEKLWEAGWNPTEKTKTHFKFLNRAKPGEKWGKKVLTKEEYEAKKEAFSYSGWKVNEENLQTLPEDAPKGAFKLAEWLTLQGRMAALRERIKECEDDRRIRTKFWHIGAWTHRMSHSNPSLANISSPFHGEPKNAVELVKSMYDAKMREMFVVDDNSYLVGTDAESIQLRILAHYLKNEEYVHAIVSGKKENQTDIHNVNRRALGLEYLTRDHAKTFIYAWLLGAGVAKVSRILGCSMEQAKRAVESFIESTKGLGELKHGRIRRDAKRGYFEGLDGRKVINPEEYLMLAGYLQNGESVCMKHANILWDQWAREEKINFRQVNFVHDEWQAEVNDSLDAAERLGELQCKSLEKVGEDLNLFCPLSGETQIGTSWLETH